MAVTLAGAALLFPGQGAQTPGMGRALVEGGFQSSLLKLSEKAGIPLQRLLVSGTADELRPTEVAQPALFYTGVALAELLMERGLEPVAAAGHSLGEYCAVVAAGALTATDGMRLVLERGRLMGDAREGTMAAVLGLELSPLEALCLQVESAGECCVVANDNAPGQVVVSGSRAGVERLSELAKDAGARRVVQLNVGGAFHSPLMAQAAEAFASLLDQVQLEKPRFPVAAGVTGTLSRTAAEIRGGLREQLTGRVRWVEVVGALAEAGAETFWECGPGTTLAGLGKRILPAAPTISVDTPEHASEALAGAPVPERRSPLPGEA
ncbi:MAG: ACP S-malonyltransferase [Candidatus Dormiibacterota bacterium]